MSEVRVKVTAENQTRTGFQQALGDARKFGTEARRSVAGGLSGIGGEIRSSLAGALAGIGIGQFVRNIFDQFGRINDLSQQFGVSSESLQRLGQVASESGSSLEQVAVALSTLTRNVQSAQSGTGAQAEALQKLGLSARELANLTPEQAFLKLADAFAGATNRNEAYAAALDLIGSRQRNLIPLLQQGGAAILEQASQVQVASDEIIKKADEVGDRFARLGQQLTASLGPIAVTLGNTFLDAFESIKTRVQQLAGFITSALLAAGQAATGNFGTAKDILSGAVDEWQRLGEEFQKTRAEIWKEPASRAMTPLPPEDETGDGMTSRERAAAEKDRKAQEKEQARQAEEAAKEQERTAKARRSIDQDIALTEAKLRGDKGAEEDILQQRDIDRAMESGATFEQAANLAATNALQRQMEAASAAEGQGRMVGSFGASSLQRIGFASNEFFDTRRKEDPSKIMERMVSEQKKTNQILGGAEPLVLPASS